MSESDFTRMVIDLARLCRWRVAHFRTVQIARKSGATYFATPVQGDGAGFPDLILVRKRRCIAAELKVGKNNTSEAQDEWLAAFRGTGSVEAFVWRPEEWEEIERVLA